MPLIQISKKIYILSFPEKEKEKKEAVLYRMPTWGSCGCIYRLLVASSTSTVNKSNTECSFSMYKTLD